MNVFASVDGAQADDVAKARFGGVIDLMRDPRQSTFAFVMYPEATPILEAARVVANYVLPAAATSTPFGHARRAMQARYLPAQPAHFDAPVMTITLLPQEDQPTNEQ